MKSFQEYLNEEAEAESEFEGQPVELQNLYRVLGTRYGQTDVATSNLVKDEIARFKKNHGEDLGMFMWTMLKAWTGQAGQRVTQAGLDKKYDSMLDPE